MKRRKIFISIVLSILMLLVSFVPIFGKNIPVANSPELMIENFSGTIPIIKAIQNAKKSIYLEIYGFTQFDIADALGKAALRGIDVKVMMEKSPVGGDSENWDVKNKLIHYGIPIKWANPEYFLTHAKFMVIDKKEAMVNTYNFTYSTFNKNREFGIAISDPIKVKEIEEIFENDWNRKEVVNKDPDIVLSPVDARDKIEKLLNSAQTSIDIWEQEVEDDKLIDILQKKTNQGIKVRIIIPPLYRVGGNFTAVDKLGIEHIRALPDPYVHAKLIIIDKKVAYIGSNNFSSTSLDSNRELGIILDNTKVLNTLNTIFEMDWERTIDPNKG